MPKARRAFFSVIIPSNHLSRISALSNVDKVSAWRLSLPLLSVVSRLVALENMAMHLALIVVPNLAARLGEHGLDRQQEVHLLRLEGKRCCQATALSSGSVM